MPGIMMMKIRSYTELCKFKSFEERFEYLRLDGIVGDETFGWDRYLNQILYKSPEWLSVRNKVIVRDCGCDLGLEGYDIFGKVIAVNYKLPCGTKAKRENTHYAFAIKNKKWSEFKN